MKNPLQGYQDLVNAHHAQRENVSVINDDAKAEDLPPQDQAKEEAQEHPDTAEINFDGLNNNNN